jgi:hypothetical protein
MDCTSEVDMDDRRITRDERTQRPLRMDSRSRPSSRGWREWSSRSLSEFLDRHAAVDEGPNHPDERLRSPDDEALPV